MAIIAAVLPVIVMLAMGKCLSLKNTVSKETVSGMKNLVSGILLPVVIFNALLTMQFSTRSLTLSLVVYALYTAALFFALKMIAPKMKYQMSGFLMLGCEGGMMGYALYTSLFGKEALSTLMEIDLGNILFAFTFFIVLIKMANSKETDTKKVIAESLKTPLVIVVALALLLNVTGAGTWLLNSSIGVIYSSVVSMITSPVSALILLCVGYELEFDLSMMKDVMKVSAARLAVMTAITVILMTAGHSLLISKELEAAVLLYAVLPPQFITPIFMKDEKESAFAATTLSFYTLITIIGYVVIAAVMA